MSPADAPDREEVKRELRFLGVDAGEGLKRVIDEGFASGRADLLDAWIAALAGWRILADGAPAAYDFSGFPFRRAPKDLFPLRR